MADQRTLEIIPGRPLTVPRRIPSLLSFALSFLCFISHLLTHFRINSPKGRAWSFWLLLSLQRIFRPYPALALVDYCPLFSFSFYELFCYLFSPIEFHSSKLTSCLKRSFLLRRVGRKAYNGPGRAFLLTGRCLHRPRNLLSICKWFRAAFHRPDLRICHHARSKTWGIPLQ